MLCCRGSGEHREDYLLRHEFHDSAIQRINSVLQSHISMLDQVCDWLLLLANSTLWQIFSQIRCGRVNMSSECSQLPSTQHRPKKCGKKLYEMNQKFLYKNVNGEIKMLRKFGVLQYFNSWFNLSWVFVEFV